MRKIHVEVTFQPMAQVVEVSADKLAKLTAIGASPEEWAIEVAKERLADTLRDGDVMWTVYPKAEFKVVK